MEEEIVFLRTKVEGMKKILKSSQAFDGMVNYHRFPFDKSSLEYVSESSNKNENFLNKKDVKKPERNGDAPSSNKGKEENQVYNRRNLAPRRNIDDVKDVRGNGYHQRISRQKGFRSTLRESPSSKYQSSFFGYFILVQTFVTWQKTINHITKIYVMVPNHLIEIHIIVPDNIQETNLQEENMNSYS